MTKLPGYTKKGAPQGDSLEEMAITVSPEENRPVSFTNKEAAYYYTQSHANDHPEHAWFKGLTIAQQKVFDGYELFMNGKKTGIEKSILQVFPHKSVRKYPEGWTEEFWLFDRINALEIGIQGMPAEAMLGIELEGLEPVAGQGREGWIMLKSPDPSRTYLVGVASINGNKIQVAGKAVLGKNTEGYFLAAGNSSEELGKLISQYRTSREKWKAEREARIREIVENTIDTSSSNDSLDMALKWLGVTTDQLLGHQRGHGIYAGLPWFAEYWGRDQFISLPGACLVLGKFDIAKKILLSFAKFQDTDPKSKFYGRVPNIVKAGAVDYHTTDGTPRFISQLREYVKYAGDRGIIPQLYPNVRHSIEGALKNWTDASGYLIHEDNETWMDARRNYDKASYSPRSTRANDIQALWHEQLLSGVYFAQAMEDSVQAIKWQEVADKVKANFESDFSSPDQTFLADRLDEEDRADYKLRPNQLFAFDLIEDEDKRLSALKTCWEELVYPWGTASLNRQDDFFHPFHLQWASYHKDEAYHNGTIWLWLNGMAMQRMLEFNQVETAYDLFRRMNLQVLRSGVVGGLNENLDAYPHRGESYPKLTGTYLQAWSNAEQLRVWYQYFIGIRPDLINETIHMAPRIPAELKFLKNTVRVGKGKINFAFQRRTGLEEFSYEFEGFSGQVVLDLVYRDEGKLDVEPGNFLFVKDEGTSYVVTLFKGKNSKEILGTFSMGPSQSRVPSQDKYDRVLKGISYCKPLSEEAHPVLKQKFDGDRRIE